MNIGPKVFLSLFLLSVLSSCATQKTNPLGLLFDHHGVAHVQEADSIQFTFHVQKPDKVVQRRWKWFPKTNRVHNLDEDVSFMLNAPTSEKEVSLNKIFTNDSYWLLFPFQLFQNPHSYSVEITRDVKSPIRDLKSDKFTIMYNGGGYTPNDIYELFVDPQSNEVVAWIYRKGGAKEATKITTWEKTTSFKGFLIAQEHNSKTPFRVWFSDIDVH